MEELLGIIMLASREFCANFMIDRIFDFWYPSIVSRKNSILTFTTPLHPYTLKYKIMKMKLLLPTAIASMLSLGNAFAGMTAPVETYQHTLTYSLSLSSEERMGPVPMGKAASKSQKLTTTRFSNKEMLEALLEQDEDIAIAMGGSIKGWSIILITNAEGDVLGTAITKKNASPIDVTEYFGAEVGPAIEGITPKKNSVQIQSVSLAQVSIDLFDLTTDLQGVLNVNSVYTEDDLSFTEIIQSANFTDLTGYWSLGLSVWEAAPDAVITADVVEEFAGIVTGTVRAGGPKLFNVPN